MKKKLLLMPLGLLLAVVVVSIVMPLFISPEGYKPAISAKLEEVTGYKVGLGGEISIRLLPFARVKLENVVVASPLLGLDRPFIRVQVLDLGVKLLPLITGNIEVTNMSLKNPVLDLVRGPAGANWQARKVTHSLVSPEMAQTMRVDENASMSPMPRRVLLNDLTISNGSVTYRDTQKKQEVVLKGLHLKAGMRSLSSPFLLEAEAVWNKQPVSLKAKLATFGLLASADHVPANISFKSEAVRFSAEGEVNHGQFVGVLKLKSESLLAALNWLSGKPNPPGMRTLPFAVDGQVACSRLKCALSNTAIALADTKLTGTLKTDFTNEKPIIVADMETQNLDVTPYLPKEKSAGLSLISPAFADISHWNATPFDLSTISALDGNVAIKAAKFTAGSFKTGKASLHVRAADGSMLVDAVSIDIYGGNGKLSLVLADDAHTEANLHLKAVDLGPLLIAISGEDKFSGKADADFTLASEAKSERALVSNLSGAGTLHISDGSMKGIDIADMVRGVKSAFMEVNTAKRKTDFGDLDASFTIKSGIISNNDLLVKAPLFRAGGKGTVNLPAYTINYRLTPQIADTLKGQGSTRSKGIGVPILITGPLDNPSYAPDVGGMVEEVVKNPEALKENIKGAKGAVKDLLKDGKSLLKGLR